MSDFWYYAAGEKTVGPVSTAELTNILARVSRASDVLVWHDGFADWQFAGSVPELGLAFVKPPPLPTAVQEPSSFSSVQIEPQPNADRSSNHDDDLIVKASTTNEGFLKRAAGIATSLIGAAIGIGLSKALGAVFWIPVLLICLSYFVWKRLAIRSELLHTVALTTAHISWFLVGILTLAALGKPNPDLFDLVVEVIVVSAIIVWVFQTQSKAALYTLLGYQIFAVAMNFVTIEATTGSIQPFMYIHVLMHTAEVAASIYAIYYLRRNSFQSVSVV